MGTNFYLIRKVQQKQKEELQRLIDKDDFESVADLITVINRDTVIHIGKRSGGWKFLWDVHDFRYFKPTKESLQEFLKSGEIKDEYGEKFTYNQFWNDELDGFLEGNDLYDGESYDAKHGRPFRGSYNSRREFGEKHGVAVNQSDEFYIDELRCTIHEDFS